MGITAAKDKLKEIITFELLDQEGEINSQGNYLCLSGLKKISIDKYAFEFTICIAGFSLTGAVDAIENRLSTLIKDVFDFELNHNIEFDMKVNLVKIDKLFIYQIKLTVLDEIS